VALEAGCEVDDVGRVEANGRAEVDGAQLATLDQALDGSWMDVKRVSRFPRREQSRSVACLARLRRDATRGDTAAWLGPYRLALDRIGLKERERQLLRRTLHGRNLSATRILVNTQVTLRG
jgi:hypothetical protein